jgi:hypothetical protein
MPPKPPLDDKQELDRELDFELEETFPASDPLDVTRPAPHRKPARKPARVVMIVTFPWETSEDEVHAQSVAQARELASRGEFLSKLILRDAATKTSGAVYVFANRAAAEKWRDDLRRRRGPDVEARIFEVNEEASRLDGDRTDRRSSWV